MCLSYSIYRGLEPRTQLSLEYRSCIGAAHDPKEVKEVRDSGGVPMSRFPQVQYVLCRTGLSGEVIYVSVEKLK